MQRVRRASDGLSAPTTARMRGVNVVVPRRTSNGASALHPDVVLRIRSPVPLHLYTIPRSSPVPARAAPASPPSWQARWITPSSEAGGGWGDDYRRKFLFLHGTAFTHRWSGNGLLRVAVARAAPPAARGGQQRPREKGNYTSLECAAIGSAPGVVSCIKTKRKQCITHRGEWRRKWYNARKRGLARVRRRVSVRRERGTFMTHLLRDLLPHSSLLPSTRSHAIAVKR
ncbi:hypothetical protein C8R47DRAFT_1117877 [Mycena vitilis]|nr:hypothetical protein C8R47DRAFT_1117877 [Mycena vitilis]